MGWASGSGLMDDIITVIFSEIPEKSKRFRIYTGIIKAMENFDWDTQDACLGHDPEFDRALGKLHPTRYED
jgi:hypothetical protein